MPRYFFNTKDGHIDRDEEGEELPDIEAAQQVAVRFLGEILRDSPPDLLSEDFHVEVVSEDGLVLFRLTVFATVAAAATH